MSVRLRHLPADVLGLTPLERAVLSGSAPAELGVALPRRAADVPLPDERLASDEREELVARLEREVGGLGTHVHALDAVRRLREPHASLVVCSEPGRFLGGPLAQLFAALGALRLAAALEARTGAPVVAAFVAHDGDPLDSASPLHRARFLNEKLELTTVGLALAHGQHSLGDTPLDDERHRLASLTAHVSQLVWDGPHSRAAIELFAPRAGETLPRATARALGGLIGHLGLVPIDARWLRADLARALARVAGAEPTATLARGSERFAAAGGSVRQPLESAALVLRREGTALAPLRAGGEGFRYGGEPGSRTGLELAAEIVDAPLAFTAGPLLRPLVEDLVLPVAARVGGWEALEALVVTAPLRPALALAPAVFVPRPSVTLTGVGEERSLERLGLDAEAVLRAAGTLAPPRAAAGTARVAASLRAALERATAELLGAKPSLAELEPGLAQQLRGGVGETRELFERLARKVERVEQNRAGTGQRHYRRLNNGLCPDGAAQERVLTTLAAVARHGTAWIDELFAELEPFPSEHVLASL